MVIVMLTRPVYWQVAPVWMPRFAPSWRRPVPRDPHCWSDMDERGEKQDLPSFRSVVQGLLHVPLTIAIQGTCRF